MTPENSILENPDGVRRLQSYPESRMVTPITNPESSAVDDRMKTRFKLFPHLALLLIIGCASDPVHYAAFSNVDHDTSGAIEWYEFKAVYPEASPKSFMEADQDKDGAITPEEWDAYMENYPPE